MFNIKIIGNDVLEETYRGYNGMLMKHFRGKVDKCNRYGETNVWVSVFGDEARKIDVKVGGKIKCIGEYAWDSAGTEVLHIKKIME